MGAVDWTYYSEVYMGTEADEASFPALCARAEDVVGAMTRFVDISTQPDAIQTLCKKAICAQVDFFALNGVETASGGAVSGFTVGKVSISAKSGEASRGGRMADNISPMVWMYLEQTGLLNPQVQTLPGMPFVGWYFC